MYIHIWVNGCNTGKHLQTMYVLRIYGVNMLVIACSAPTGLVRTVSLSLLQLHWQLVWFAAVAHTGSVSHLSGLRKTTSRMQRPAEAGPARLPGLWTWAEPRSATRDCTMPPACSGPVLVVVALGVAEGAAQAPMLGAEYPGSACIEVLWRCVCVLLSTEQSRPT